MEIGEPGGFLVWLTDALDSVVRLGRTHLQESGAPRTDEDVFESVLPVVSKLVDHQGLAFMTVGSDGVEFDLSFVAQPARVAQIEGEVQHQISQGTFAWALYRSGPVIVPASAENEWLLLHVLETSSRVWGMFLAVLPPSSSFVPDVSEKLLSLVMSETAGMLERQRGTGSLWLRGMVDARTAALKRSEQAAREAARAKSASLVRIGHEVRTPLNGVVGMTNLLLESELSADQRAQAETIQESAHALLETINGVLEASRPDGRPAQLHVPPPSTEAVVFDQAAAGLMVGGDWELFSELIALFRDAWIPLQESVTTSLARGDMDQVAEAAHRIKGSASNVGAVGVRAAAERLEWKARVNDEAGAVQVWLVLDGEIERFLRAVTEAPTLERL